jgi:hypothetical protein
MFSDSAHVVRAPRAADLARRHRPLPYDRCADMARLSGLEHTLFWRGVLCRRHRRGPARIDADSGAVFARCARDRRRNPADDAQAPIG